MNNELCVVNEKRIPGEDFLFFRILIPGFFIQYIHQHSGSLDFSTVFFSQALRHLGT
jgi:lysozyme family protein